MSRLQTMILWLYANLLLLYPAEFRAQFADEMVGIFRQLLSEASNSALRLGLREIGALLVGVVREHQRVNTRTPEIPLRRALVVLAIPALVGCGILLLRPLTVFYLSGKIWILLTAMTIALMGVGWLLERRLSVLALPSLGLMLFAAIWLFYMPPAPGSHLPVYVQASAPLVLLVAALLLLRRWLGWKTWVPYIAALPLTALILSAIIIAANGAFGLPLRTLLRDYVLGALLPIGALSLIVLAGLPLARRFGSKAVLLLVGYLFFDLLGLSGSLSTSLAQQIASPLYVILFMLIIPLLTVRASGLRDERRAVLIPIALGYAGILLVKILQGEGDITFTLYRTNELLLTLIALYLALRLYANLFTNAAPETPATLTAAGLDEAAA